MVNLNYITVLYFIFIVKHFVADGPLQTEYMLGKFAKDGWVKPLAAHAGVHAGFTLLFGLFINWRLAVPAALLDFVIHFTMDRIKASPNMMGQWKAISSNEYAWLKMGYLPVKPEDLIDSTNVIARKGTKEQLEQIWASNVKYYLALLFDQAVHASTDMLAIYLLLSFR